MQSIHVVNPNISLHWIQCRCKGPTASQLFMAIVYIENWMYYRGLLVSLWSSKNSSIHNPSSKSLIWKCGRLHTKKICACESGIQMNCIPSSDIQLTWTQCNSIAIMTVKSSYLCRYRMQLRYRRCCCNAWLHTADICNCTWYNYVISLY